MTFLTFNFIENILSQFDRISRRGFLLGSMIFVVLTQLTAFALASETHAVIQKGRAFNLKELNISAGDTVQFSDEDEFIHQVYVQSADFNFDSAEQSPGESIPVKFTSRGNFEVHCHIHPKMLLLVNVK